MDRRSILKGLLAGASAPLIGNFVATNPQVLIPDGFDLSKPEPEQPLVIATQKLVTPQPLIKPGTKSLEFVLSDWSISIDSDPGGVEFTSLDNRFAHVRGITRSQIYMNGSIDTITQFVPFPAKVYGRGVKVTITFDES